MERFVDLKEISDGKRYHLNDMVKVGCEDCKGCFHCCQNMGNSIVLDPYDIYRLTTSFNQTFEQLLMSGCDLNVVDGVILPNLKMNPQTNRCNYLNEEGRCSIHPYRPSICRIFPLGRIYENRSFSYILQVDECKKEKKTKVKLKKWIDTQNLSENENFITNWHYFLKDVTKQFPNCKEEDVKAINMLILNVFFVTLYQGDRDFYEQYKERMTSVKEILKTQYRLVLE